MPTLTGNLNEHPIVSFKYKCHNLSKQNVKLILKILSDLELLRGVKNQKTLYSTRSCVNWAFLARVAQFKTRVKRAF
jgi:hypothetical protein